MSDLWNSMQLIDSGAGRNSFAPPAANLADLSTMPWSTPNPCHVMEFTAIAPPVPSSTSHQPHLHAKRKPSFYSSDPVPVKKLLTEDSMAEHLSNLRISGDGSGMQDSCLGPPHGESLSNYTVNMTQWDLEKKLRTAQKITVCNEILELDKERDSILPEILLNRMTKPCSALMLWQPPPILSSLIDGQSAPADPQPRDSQLDEMET